MSRRAPMRSSCTVHGRIISRISVLSFHSTTDRRHRRIRLGQIFAGIRHAVCRRPAPLCRDFLALRAPVLERMDKPKVDLIEGIPPAIAIDQVNPVRTSRSTVGTMTEINDHLKLLFARAATLYCRQCQQPVRRDDAPSIAAALAAPAAALGDPRLLICFPVPVPKACPARKSAPNLNGRATAASTARSRRC